MDISFLQNVAPAGCRQLQTVLLNRSIRSIRNDRFEQASIKGSVFRARAH